MNLRQFECRFKFERRQDGRQTFGKHCLARTRRTNKQYVCDTKPLDGSATSSCQSLPCPYTLTPKASNASRFSANVKTASRVRTRAAYSDKAVRLSASA